MLYPPALTRRSFMQQSAAASALALGAATLPHPARAAAPFANVQGPGVYRYRLGNFELTALYDGIWYSPIDDKFVRNASGRAVNRALASAFLKPGVLPISITALLVNTGSKLVLLDTGSAGQITDTAGQLNANLAVAGVKPEDIDVVVISHFHPDHIDGIKTKDGDKVFPKAEIMVPEPEWAFWMNDANLARATGTVHKYFLNARRIFKDIAGEVHRYKPGAELMPGIVSIPAYGHTPGHTAFALHSDNQSMLVMSDTVRNPYLFARHPDWQPGFDMDGPLAVKARRRMLDRAAADRMLVEAYHFPFPACGHMVRAGAGYELVPVMWSPQP
ncbi:MAG: MBL fold metallo-hydrolase [Pseudolabrys sp.]|jgi:glyoxylase-like metal-dependent hydrolase (beta-lactamase superfamily II)